MKNKYIIPKTSLMFYDPILLETASFVNGEVQDDEGGNQGNIGYDGPSTGQETPDAKKGFWDDDYED